MATKLVVVGNYRRPEEAHVARLQLEQEGLRVFVENQNYDMGDGPDWPADGVEVLVPEDQVTVAKWILGEPGN